MKLSNLFLSFRYVVCSLEATDLLVRVITMADFSKKKRSKLRLRVSNMKMRTFLTFLIYGQFVALNEDIYYKGRLMRVVE